MSPVTRAEKRRFVDYFEQVAEAAAGLPEGHPTKGFYASKLVAATEIGRLLGFPEDEIKAAGRRAKRRV